MHNFERLFNQKTKELDLYLSFIENLDNKATTLSKFGKSSSIDNDLIAVLYANTFIMLYNIAESCITEAIEEVYIDISNNNIAYDDLRDEVKIQIISFLKQHVKADTFVNNVTTIATDIIKESFNSKKLLSGNLDARKIRDLGSKYGFSTAPPQTITIDSKLESFDSNKLLVVKEKRNDLAHGVYSFKETGKNYTYQDLVSIKSHVVQYLRQIIDSITLYIDSKKYLS